MTGLRKELGDLRVIDRAPHLAREDSGLPSQPRRGRSVLIHGADTATVRGEGPVRNRRIEAIRPAPQTNDIEREGFIVRSRGIQG